METLRKMSWDALKHEYDLDAKRLLPWEGLTAPFGGAWCVVRAGTRSLLHEHDENEIFICVSGRARVCMDDRAVEVEKGDVVAIEPGARHCVDNSDQSQDFHMYSIWWDRESAEAFLDGAKDGNG